MLETASLFHAAKRATARFTMVVASYIGDATQQLEHGAFAPLHRQLALRSREKSSVSAPRSESTASNDAYSDSATGTSKSESTRPTSVHTHRDSFTSVSSNKDACENPKRVESASGEASKPSYHGPRRPPKSRRHYDAVIIDARTDSAQRARSTAGPECYNGRPRAPNRHYAGRHQGSDWREKSHPILYTGAYPRVSQQDALVSSTVVERPNSRPSADSSQEQPPCGEEPPLQRWLWENSITSVGPKWSLERKRRVEKWVDDASGPIRRLLSPGMSFSDGSIRYPQLQPETQSALDVLGIKSEGAADNGTLRQRIRGALAAPRLSGGSLRTHTAAGQPSCRESASPESTGGNASQGRSSKRKVTAGARRLEQIPEDEEDDQREAPQPGPKGGKGKETDAFFACPYFKHDPVKYVGREWRGCCGPGWQERALVQASPAARNRCKRCGECFEDDQGLDAHIRREEPCELRNTLPVEGFDAKQEAQLRSRKRSIVSLSEVEKWQQVYTVLFPRVPKEHIPSPFYEYVEVQHPSSLSDYEEYALREMDGYLRPMLEQGLEADLGIVEPAAKRRAIEWLKGMNRRLLNDFRRRRRRHNATVSPEKPSGYPQPTSTIASQTATSSGNTQPEPPRLTPEWSIEEEQLFEISPGTVYAETFSLTAGAGGCFYFDEPNSLDDFDFDDYSYRTPVTLVVEPPLSGSDSAYGSMSTKESSGCPPEGGEEM